MMRIRPSVRRLTILLATALVGAITFVASGGAPVKEAAKPLPPPANRHVDFAKDIKPLFEASCVQCHAKGKDKGGFSLETKAALLKGGDTGPAAVVGKSDQSLIVQMVAGVDPDSVMPKKGTKWTREQIGLLRAWIDQGMPWDDTVTFAKPEPANLRPRAVELPDGQEQHPVDRLLAAYFAGKGITPPPVVDDRVFARRAYLDTIGLLPTPEQMEAFLWDAAPDKRAKLVRTLLDDKRGYADHWLTFWNDLLRNDYKGAGYIDGGRRQISAWLYGALVNDMPYDQFVAELVNPSKLSEGFSRGIIWRGAVNASMQPPVQAAQNIAQVFMGVNLKCASCHDSFVSDWTLADAYGLAAVYSDETLELIHCDKPTGKKASPRFLYPQFGTLTAEASKPERLKSLADLITGPKDGRLSRTVVNRLWNRLMGRGLVETMDDMDRPAWDADLLDWLAEDLVAHKYDLKHTIEVILTSRAYQLPSVEPADAKGAFVFRGPLVRRLTAEQFCDAISSFTGDWARMPSTLNLDFTAGGMVSVKPAAWLWTDEPVEVGQDRAFEQAKEKAKAAAKRVAEQKAKQQVEKDKKDEKDKAEAKPEGKSDKPAAVREVKTAEKTEKADKSDKPAEEAKKPSDEKSADKPAADKPSGDAAAKPPTDPSKVTRPERHRVAFRKVVVLDKAPDEAFAVLGASQGFGLVVNGREVRSKMTEGRVALYDLKGQLKAGLNVIALDVSSHTEKGLNDAEREQYPQSRNHVNKVSGVAFYLDADVGGKRVEVVSDATWRARRAPEDGWKDLDYKEADWPYAAPLPREVTPVDEGPSLPPVQRKDFANEPVDVAMVFRTATSTAAQPGNVRASLLAADPLMTALDRPNREQVTSARNTAATTLQALALTNGDSLDARLKRAAAKLVPEATKDPAGRTRRFFRQALSRDPTDEELKIAGDLLGEPVSREGMADFLWGLTLLPEFQFIR